MEAELPCTNAIVYHDGKWRLVKMAKTISIGVAKSTELHNTNVPEEDNPVRNPIKWTNDYDSYAEGPSPKYEIRDERVVSGSVLKANLFHHTFESPTEITAKFQNGHIFWYFIDGTYIRALYQLWAATDTSTPLASADEVSQQPQLRLEWRNQYNSTTSTINLSQYDYYTYREMSSTVLSDPWEIWTHEDFFMEDAYDHGRGTNWPFNSSVSSRKKWFLTRKSVHESFKTNKNFTLTYTNSGANVKAVPYVSDSHIRAFMTLQETIITQSWLGQQVTTYNHQLIRTSHISWAPNQWSRNIAHYFFEQKEETYFGDTQRITISSEAPLEDVKVDTPLELSSTVGKFPTTYLNPQDLINGYGHDGRTSYGYHQYIDVIGGLSSDSNSHALALNDVSAYDRFGQKLTIKQGWYESGQPFYGNAPSPPSPSDPFPVAVWNPAGSQDPVPLHPSYPVSNAYDYENTISADHLEAAKTITGDNSLTVDTVTSAVRAWANKNTVTTEEQLQFVKDVTDSDDVALEDATNTLKTWLNKGNMSTFSHPSTGANAGSGLPPVRLRLILDSDQPLIDKIVVKDRSYGGGYNKEPQRKPSGMIVGVQANAFLAPFIETRYYTWPTPGSNDTSWDTSDANNVTTVYLNNFVFQRSHVDSLWEYHEQFTKPLQVFRKDASNFQVGGFEASGNIPTSWNLSGGFALSEGNDVVSETLVTEADHPRSGWTVPSQNYLQQVTVSTALPKTSDDKQLLFLATLPPGSSYTYMPPGTPVIQDNEIIGSIELMFIAPSDTNNPSALSVQLFRSQIASNATISLGTVMRNGSETYSYNPVAGSRSISSEDIVSTKMSIFSSGIEIAPGKSQISLPLVPFRPSPEEQFSSSSGMIVARDNVRKTIHVTSRASSIQPGLHYDIFHGIQIPSGDWSLALGREIRITNPALSEFDEGRYFILDNSTASASTLSEAVTSLEESTPSALYNSSLSAFVGKFDGDYKPATDSSLWIVRRFDATTSETIERFSVKWSQPHNIANDVSDPSIVKNLQIEMHGHYGAGGIPAGTEVWTSDGTTKLGIVQDPNIVKNYLTSRFYWLSYGRILAAATGSYWSWDSYYIRDFIQMNNINLNAFVTIDAFAIDGSPLLARGQEVIFRPPNQVTFTFTRVNPESRFGNIPNHHHALVMEGVSKTEVVESVSSYGESVAPTIVGSRGFYYKSLDVKDAGLVQAVNPTNSSIYVTNPPPEGGGWNLKVTGDLPDKEGEFELFGSVDNWTEWLADYFSEDLPDPKAPVTELTNVALVVDGGSLETDTIDVDDPDVLNKIKDQLNSELLQGTPMSVERVTPRYAMGASEFEISFVGGAAKVVPFAFGTHKGGPDATLTIRERYLSSSGIHTDFDHFTDFIGISSGGKNKQEFGYDDNTQKLTRKIARVVRTTETVADNVGCDVVRIEFEDHVDKSIGNGLRQQIPIPKSLNFHGFVDGEWNFMAYAKGSVNGGYDPTKVPSQEYTEFVLGETLEQPEWREQDSLQQVTYLIVQLERLLKEAGFDLKVQKDPEYSRLIENTLTPIESVGVADSSDLVFDLDLHISDPESIVTLVEEANQLTDEVFEQTALGNSVSALEQWIASQATFVDAVNVVVVPAVTTLYEFVWLAILGLKAVTDPIEALLIGLGRLTDFISSQTFQIIKDTIDEVWDLIGPIIDKAMWIIDNTVGWLFDELLALVQPFFDSLAGSFRH